MGLRLKIVNGAEMSRSAPPYDEIVLDDGNFRRGYLDGFLAALELWAKPYENDRRLIQLWAERDLAKWRYAAGNMMEPPPTPPSWRALRREVFLEKGKRCSYCGDAATHVDHFLPVSKYPNAAFDISNLVPCCQRCNLEKGDMSPVEWFSYRFISGREVNQ